MESLDAKWTSIQKLSFIFIVLYASLYIASSQFITTIFIEPLWRMIIPKFAQLIGVEKPITVFTNGSGDTTYNYVQLLVFALLSFFGMIGLALLDRGRNHYQELRKWMLLLVRYYLAFQLINYGFAKLYYLQFRPPSELQLNQELGDFSPMGLLWVFMGYSKGYTMFTGALELLGGLLLLSRKTTLLGGLVAFGVMLNVMMLNFCYDVPVKILSTHMVLLSMFIIACEGKRLLQFFVFNKPVLQGADYAILPKEYRLAKNIVKGIGIALYLGFIIFTMSRASERFVSKPDTDFIRGLFEVEHYEGTFHDTRDTSAWITFNCSYSDRFYVKKSDGEKEYFQFTVNKGSSQISIKSNLQSNYSDFHYSKLENNRIQLNGIIGKDTFDILLFKKNRKKSELMDRGFHWINEYPRNR